MLPKCFGFWVFAGLWLLARVAWSQGSPAGSLPCLPWPATDALGRSLPEPSEVGPPRPERWVGIFYFLWHNEPGARSALLNGPYDVSRILQANPHALDEPDSPLWGGIGTSHYWGEPLYGYYRSTDPWVLRRHARLLSAAGIDTLIFDATNARTYPDVYLKLCAVFREVRQSGGRTPQISFMVNTQAKETAAELYRALYQPGLYRELWFEWQGKPLLLCDPAQASAEVRQFFTLRRAHWPFTMTNTPFAWHWEAAYPQPYGYTDDPAQPEQVNVSVAQNLRVRDGKVTNMSAGDARGRSFHAGREDPAPSAVNQGFNFQEQWGRARQLQPPFVMVTGWNEWIAGRWGDPKGTPVFVDQYSQEFSRDIEPMNGGHADDYYYQLVANVRRFKGADPLPLSSAPKTIHLKQAFAQWNDVAPEFHDDSGDSYARDWDGVGGLHYRSAGASNDLVAFKVATDARNVYFYGRTRQPLTAPAGSNWMWLLIDIDRSAATGWEGYDFIVNRTLAGSRKTWLEKNDGGWHWKKIVRLDLVVQNNELALAIPRGALGLAIGKTAVRFDFKWADSLQHPGEVMDFYLSGDVAPEGRFNYRFVGSR
jgi:hypothetical protein